MRIDSVGDPTVVELLETLSQFVEDVVEFHLVGFVMLVGRDRSLFGSKSTSTVFLIAVDEITLMGLDGSE